MLRALLLSTAVSVALLPAAAMAQGLPAASSNNPQTTGQQIGTNDAGGHASTNGDKDNKKSDKDMKKGGMPAGLKFDELDTNQDGKLDEEELGQYGNSDKQKNKGVDNQGERMMKLYDHDGDGAVSRDELHKGADRSKGK